MQHGHDVVADSRFMIKYIQNTYGSQLKIQEPQDDSGQAISTLVQRMCEEHMYFTSQYHRMVNPKVLPHSCNQYTWVIRTPASASQLLFSDQCPCMSQPQSLCMLSQCVCGPCNFLTYRLFLSGFWLVQNQFVQGRTRLAVHANLLCFPRRQKHTAPLPGLLLLAALQPRPNALIKRAWRCSSGVEAASYV